MKHLILILGCLVFGGCASFNGVNKKFDAKEANLQSYCDDNPAEEEFCQRKMAELQNEREIELEDVSRRHSVGAAMLMQGFANMHHDNLNCTTTVIGNTGYTRCQ